VLARSSRSRAGVGEVRRQRQARAGGQGRPDSAGSLQYGIGPWDVPAALASANAQQSEELDRRSATKPLQISQTTRPTRRRLPMRLSSLTATARPCIFPTSARSPMGRESPARRCSPTATRGSDHSLPAAGANSSLTVDNVRALLPRASRLDFTGGIDVGLWVRSFDDDPQPLVVRDVRAHRCSPCCCAGDPPVVFRILGETCARTVIPLSRSRCRCRHLRRQYLIGYSLENLSLMALNGRERGFVVDTPSSSWKNFTRYKSRDGASPRAGAQRGLQRRSASPCSR